MRKKLMLAALIVAIICVTSGAYAFLSENANVSNDDATIIETNDDIQVNPDDLNQSALSVVQTPIQNNYPDVKDDLVYIGTYAYYHKDDGITDYYIKCAECGGYVAIGDVTYPLPDAALCHNFKAVLADNYKDYAVSYDEAYACWVELGQPVFDDGSGLSAQGDPIHVDGPPAPLVKYDLEKEMPLVE